MTDGIFGFYSDNAERIQAHLQSGKALSMVLAKDLPGPNLAKGIDFGYVNAVDYKGEQRLAVAGGCYKNKVKRFDRPDPELIRKCSKSKVYMENEVYPVRVFKKRLEDPLCILLMPSLTEDQLAIFKKGYETFEVEHENEIHTAIACVYYDPSYKAEGGIIAQWYN